MTKSSVESGDHQHSMTKPSWFLKPPICPATCKCCMRVVARHAVFNSPISAVNTHIDIDGIENNVGLKQNLS